MSLLPGATETVYALGFGDQLVGRSHECDYPPPAARLPVCTEPKIHPDDSSAGVDRQIRSLVREGLSVYRVDAGRLQSLRPDLILTQMQCAVCAASEREVEAAVREWTGARPRIVSLAPARLADVFEDPVRVAAALGAPAQGMLLRDRLAARLEAVARKAQSLQNRPTVACIEWLEPLMAAGHWMPELVRLAGGVNLFGLAGQPSPWLHWAQLVEQDPDVICLMPCGYGIDRAEKELHLLAGRPEWRQLKAVRQRRVYLADGHAYFNRPGPRIVESLEMLAEILHPAVFRFGHAGIGWERA
ncbi:MAG: cobalamin-binding protein [Nitrospirota bacterium]